MKFSEGKVLGEPKLKHEATIRLRLPKQSDAKDAMDFINNMVKEDTTINSNKEFSLQEETDYIKNTIKNIENKQDVAVFAEHDSKIVGICHIRRKKYKESHVGVLSISVLESYRGIGLGKTLIRTAIDLAKKDLGLEIIELSVFASNKIAIDLYKKLGFQHTGNIPRGIKHKGKYIDHNIMVKML